MAKKHKKDQASGSKLDTICFSNSDGRKYRTLELTDNTQSDLPRLIMLTVQAFSPQANAHETNKAKAWIVSLFLIFYLMVLESMTRLYSTGALKGPVEVQFFFSKTCLLQQSDRPRPAAAAAAAHR